MKEYNVIEIVFAGSNSVLGTILSTMKYDFDISTLNRYIWVIFVDFMSFDMIEDECNELQIEDYILADRKSIRSSKNEKIS